jgi:CRP/FNR family cyclic AMP-dependent transcriptional regulator
MPGTKKSKFDPAHYMSMAALKQKTVHVAAGSLFYSQGDAANAIFYLETGRAKLIVVSKNGK